MTVEKTEVLADLKIVKKVQKKYLQFVNKNGIIINTVTVIKGGGIMPNIKSQKDRVLQSKKENLRNKAVKSNLKTVIKKADIALADGSADAQMAAVEAVSTIDKARSKGVLHKNTAARKVSKMMKKANAAK